MLRFFSFLLLALAAMALVGCGDDDDAIAATDVTREVFASALPATAPGQDLTLSRVVIPAGASLAAHHHPGPQLAWISAGTLTYTVESGEVTIRRSAGTPDEVEETVGAGETTDIETGDAVVELPGMTHAARNDGDTEIVIYLAALFEEGAPPSSPADDAE